VTTTDNIPHDGAVEEHRGLARSRIVKDNEAAGSRTPLHLFADGPGHRRNPQAIVAVLREAGADLDASDVPDRVGETPRSWAEDSP
jgi:uncharacterized protein